ncbi:hypothetical protein KFK09_012425 [Dendrobium nobile]|uniref:Pectinesterase inhibitor domain-containing protein n=1 Tax=Dendrobium nobile TaxID=94219 RepID=A0A8T3BHA4_DENNO|nr:hypothetical protein KFK09_022619 [Dendrobium nobile]KAI0511793.1 hypothetical protein KFK09_012425 [Dendrobium nobile]
MRVFIVLAVVLTLAALSHPSATAVNSNNSLKFFCSHTDYSGLCIKSIKEIAPRLKRANINIVLAILLHSIDVRARQGKAFTLWLTKQSRSSAKTLELLHDCVDAYDTALDNLASATKAIKAGDIDTRDAMLSSMISNFDSCEDGFNEFAIKSPLTDRTTVLKNMVDNCLAIGELSRP